MSIGQSSAFRSRVLNAMLWSAASSWSTKALDFAVVLVLARLLTPADFGLVSLVTIYIALANLLIEGGFAQAIVQREDIEAVHYDTAFWTSLMVGVLFTIVTYVVGPATFEYLFDEEALRPVVQTTSVLFTITALRSVQHAILTRRLRFKELALRRLAGTIVGGVTAITLALLGFGLWSLVSLFMVSTIVSTIVLWFASDWRPRMAFSARCLRELSAFGMHIVARQLLVFVNRRGLHLLIGLFLGATALGYYVLASRIILSALDLVTTAIQSVAFPAFSRLQKDSARLRSALYQAIHFTSLISFPMFLWLLSTASLLIPALLGPSWAPIVPIIQLLCFAGLLDSVGRYADSILMAYGRANLSLYIGIVYTLFNFGAFFIAVGHGVVAVAVAYVAVSYLLAPLALIAMHKLSGASYRTYFRQLFPSAVASTTMTIAVFAARYAMPEVMTPMLQLAALAGLGGIVYLLSLYLIDRTALAGAAGLVREILPGRKQIRGNEQ